MAYVHPFGSTAADLKAAIALSKDAAIHEANEEAQLAANAEAQLAAAIAASKEEEESDLICDCFFGVFRQPAVIAYIDGHCNSFEDSECNKLEYTQIHLGYQQLVDDLLTQELSDISVPATQFQRFCEQCFHGDKQLDSSFKTQLLSTDDFLVFKQMMINRRAELHQSIPPSATAKVAEEVHLSPRCEPPMDGPGPTLCEGLKETSCQQPEDVTCKPHSPGTPKAAPEVSTPPSAIAKAAEEVHLSPRCEPPMDGPKPTFCEGLKEKSCQQPEDVMCKPHSPGTPKAAPEAKSRPITLLQQPLAPSADKIGVKPVISGGREMARPKSSRKFFLYSNRNNLDGRMLEIQPANFNVAPEPWLTKPLASSVPSHGSNGSVLEESGRPKLEEVQQRAEHWRQQRDLLRRKNGADGTNIACLSAPAVDQNDGSRLALELRCPDDANGQKTRSIDAAAMRQAITRQLRGTFEKLPH